MICSYLINATSIKVHANFVILIWYVGFQIWVAVLLRSGMLLTSSNAIYPVSEELSQDRVSQYIGHWFRGHINTQTINGSFRRFVRWSSDVQFELYLPGCQAHSAVSVQICSAIAFSSSHDWDCSGAYVCRVKYCLFLLQISAGRYSVNAKHQYRYQPYSTVYIIECNMMHRDMYVILLQPFDRNLSCDKYRFVIYRLPYSLDSRIFRHIKG